MLSIIIPTLNEEESLPQLLTSIKKQKFSRGEEDKLSSSHSLSRGESSVYEIIVADAGSKDRTKKIAEKFGARIIKGGLPAKGRNEGAKAAKGELLLFLDADVILPDDFFEKMLKEFANRKLDAAATILEPLTDKKRIKFFFNFFYNWPAKTAQKFLAFGAMGYLIKTSLHQKINGFDERIKIAEDNDYLRRAAKIGQFGILDDVKVYFSLRRYYRDGWLRTVLKHILGELHYQFFGPVKSDILKYRFNHYKKNQPR